MKIRIKHSSDIISGSLFKDKLLINNENSVKIAHGEEKEIEIPREDSSLQIKLFTGKSNILKVNKGDLVEIKHSPWILWSFLFLLMLFTALRMLNVTNTPACFIIIAICYLVFAKVLDIYSIYRLEKIQKNNWC